jgi:hypothetical protein
MTQFVRIPDINPHIRRFRYIINAVNSFQSDGCLLSQKENHNLLSFRAPMISETPITRPIRMPITTPGRPPCFPAACPTPTAAAGNIAVSRSYRANFFLLDGQLRKIPSGLKLLIVHKNEQLMK